ncbi:MAG: pyruvate kinase [Mariprofundus sp.]|nr:pyruvate kinase [Mariprofundus sp.]
MGIITGNHWLMERRTKVIATLGPASSTAEMITQLIQAGTNLFRLNMSHGYHAEHQLNIENIYKIAQALDRPVAILADLCGPKIRVGRFAEGAIVLTAGESVTITTRDILGEPGMICSQYKALAGDVAIGHTILLADGLMELEVEAIEETEISCMVLQGGLLSDHKGMNLPDTDISTPALTDKDKQDATFALHCGVDYLALSFVRDASDVQQLKDLIKAAGSTAGIVAKIERAEALKHVSEIIQVADAMMVARGDLGVELPPEQVPIIQQELILAARMAHKPVIIATQMMESMIENIRPTRAEVSDVSYAVASGADAVMLSAETATGLHPVAVVEMMDRVARETESSMWHNGGFSSFSMQKTSKQELSVSGALAISTAQISRDLQIKSIFVISESGASAAAVSSARPTSPIVAITSFEKTYRKMTLFWGVRSVFERTDKIVNTAALAKQWARTLDVAKDGERILLMRWFHQDPEKSTPSITVLNIV